MGDDCLRRLGVGGRRALFAKLAGLAKPGAAERTHLRKACPMQMCVRVPRRDRILAAVCFSAFTICAALFVATAAFWFWMSTHVSASNFPLFSIVLTEFALGIGAAAVIQVSNENARNSVTKRSVIVCVAALLIAMIASRTWLDEPMHDFAMGLGSHGRWGCLTVDESGPHYLVRTDTAPIMLFGPLIMLLAWRGRRVANRGCPRVRDRADGARRSR